MKCIYHSKDLDGKCSGAIIKYKFPECELIGLDYHEMHKVPELVEPQETVYMVDISMDASDMFKLKALCRLVWIDHHESAIKAVDAYAKETDSPNIPGLRGIGVGACKLVWHFLFGDPVPKVVELISRWDVWDHDTQVKEFQYGLKSIPNGPEKVELWASMFENSEVAIEPLCRRGRNVIDYTRQQHRYIIEKHSFPIEFGGIKFLAVNQCGGNSELFDEPIAEGKADAGMIFYTSGGKWIVSMFSNNPDVKILDLAVKLGGGGHKSACGFHADHLPFLP